MVEKKVIEALEKLKNLSHENQWSEIKKYSIEELEVLAVGLGEPVLKDQYFEILHDILLERAIKLNRNFEWSNENKQKFLKVNDKFMFVFEKAYNEALSVAHELENRISLNDKFIKDYEIEIKITPYMDDRFYNDNSGDIGCILSEPSPINSPIYFSFGHTHYHHEKPIYMDKSLNWNIEYFGDMFRDNYICYEIHELLDSKWSFYDIINIKKIWADVEVIHQYYIEDIE
jgi:hypothetical protein